MLVGTVEMSILLRSSQSLKDKRRFVKSLKDRLRNRFEVSVAEVDGQDRVQQAVIGVAVVSNDKRHIESVLTKVVNFTNLFRGCELASARQEIL